MANDWNLAYLSPIFRASLYAAELRKALLGLHNLGRRNYPAAAVIFSFHLPRLEAEIGGGKWQLSQELFRARLELRLTSKR
jgi:hypothetical protein